MSIAAVSYKVKTASKDEICSYLYSCSDNFSPPLKQRVDLDRYGEKIFDKAITFEAWHNKELIGLVAAYFNDSNGYSGYITNVSVTSYYMNQGIMTSLMNRCIEYAKQYGFKNIALEVSASNYSVIHLYEKFGFKEAETRGDTLIMNLYINWVNNNRNISESL